MSLHTWVGEWMYACKNTRNKIVKEAFQQAVATEGHNNGSIGRAAFESAILRLRPWRRSNYSARLSYEHVVGIGLLLNQELC